MSFFYKSATQRRAINSIRCLQDENGRLMGEYDAIAKIAKDFF